MNISELKKYLNNFKDTDEIGIIIVNSTKRKYYPVSSNFLISDMACICLEVDMPKDIDAENLKHTTLDGQMNIEDFIGGAK